MVHVLKYAIPAVVVAGVVATVALHEDSSAFCDRAVECNVIADYDRCVECVDPVLGEVDLSLLKSNGGKKKGMTDIACVTILWTAANHQITTCASKK